MKQTVLGEGQYVFADGIRNKTIACIAVVILTLVLNVVITLSHTRDNLVICMWLNVLFDVSASWFVIWQLDRYIVPYRRLLRIFKKQGSIICGEIQEISQKTERYYGFDCWVISVDGHRLFVIDNNTISLNKGETVTLETVHGIVKEVQL